jgi:hypothetical protein
MTTATGAAPGCQHEAKEFAITPEATDQAGTPRLPEACDFAYTYDALDLFCNHEGRGLKLSIVLPSLAFTHPFKHREHHFHQRTP